MYTWFFKRVRQYDVFTVERKKISTGEHFQDPWLQLFTGMDPSADKKYLYTPREQHEFYC